MSYHDRYIEAEHQKLMQRFLSEVGLDWTYFGRRRLNDLHNTIHGHQSEGGPENMSEDLKRQFVAEHSRLGTHNHSYRARKARKSNLIE